MVPPHNFIEKNVEIAKTVLHTITPVLAWKVFSNYFCHSLNICMIYRCMSHNYSYSFSQQLLFLVAAKFGFRICMQKKLHYHHDHNELKNFKTQKDIVMFSLWTLAFSLTNLSQYDMWYVYNILLIVLIEP